MNDIIVREARPEDAGQLISYMKIVGGETDNLTFGKEGIPVSEDQEAAFLTGIHDDPRSVLYCAWKGNKLVGTAALTGLPRRMSHRAGMNISVLKAEWNKGTGTMLLQHIIDYAKNHGIEILQLEVRNDNEAAIHLYEKFGFKKTGTIPAYFKIGTEYIDFDTMNLDLR